jgi:hypothetical protein
VTVAAVQALAAAPTPTRVVLSVQQAVVVTPPDNAVFADAGQALAMSGAASDRSLLARADEHGSAPCAAPATLDRQQGAGVANVAAVLAGGMCGMGGWLQATGNDLSTDNTYDAQGGGFLAGLDRAVGPGRVGMAVGYDALNLKDTASGKAFLGTVRFGIYGGLDVGHIALSAALMDGLVNTNTTRATGSGEAQANGHGNVLAAALQLVLPVSAGGAEFRPAVGLEITRFSLSGFNEAAAAQALAVRTAAVSGVYVAPYLRLTVARGFITAQGLEATPSAALGLMVNATNPGASVGMTAQDGTGFSAAPLQLSPVAGEVGLGLVIGRGNWRLSARYTAALADNWHAQSLEGGLLVKF